MNIHPRPKSPYKHIGVIKFPIRSCLFKIQPWLTLPTQRFQMRITQSNQSWTSRKPTMHASHNASYEVRILKPPNGNAKSQNDWSGNFILLYSNIVSLSNMPKAIPKSSNHRISSPFAHPWVIPHCHNLYKPINTILTEDYNFNLRLQLL